MTAVHRAVDVAAPVSCNGCGKPVEASRRCYAVPTCEACLPANPLAHEARTEAEVARDGGEPPKLPGERWRDRDPHGRLFAVAPWLTNPATAWAWVGPGDGDTWIGADDIGEAQAADVYRAWALTERAHAEAAASAARANGLRAVAAEAALAAFQRASGCADGPTLATVLRERNALVREIRDVGTGAIEHRYAGRCPETSCTAGSTDDRDDGCPACDVLRRADADLLGSHGSDA